MDGRAGEALPKRRATGDDQQGRKTAVKVTAVAHHAVSGLWEQQGQTDGRQTYDRPLGLTSPNSGSPSHLTARRRAAARAPPLRAALCRPGYLGRWPSSEIQGHQPDVAPHQDGQAVL